jgi:hypothetical protein
VELEEYAEAMLCCDAEFSDVATYLLLIRRRHLLVLSCMIDDALLHGVLQFCCPMCTTRQCSFTVLTPFCAAPCPQWR